MRWLSVCGKNRSRSDKSFDGFHSHSNRIGNASQSHKWNASYWIYVRAIKSFPHSYRNRTNRMLALAMLATKGFNALRFSQLRAAMRHYHIRTCMLVIVISKPELGPNVTSEMV